MDQILHLSWLDVADILVISYFVHRLFLLFRGSTTLQILVGLVFLRVLLMFARATGLVWTSWFLSEVNAWAPLMIVVIFRNEIREALLQTSPIRLLVGQPDRAQAIDLTVVTEAVFRLAKARTGALLVFPNRDRLGEHVREGIALGGRFSAPILESLFAKESPVHDGAAIIRHGRIERVGTLLPLSRQVGLPEEFGTRHRAAIGLSEVSDAVVVVVSEERGDVSVAHRGVVETVEEPEFLEQVLLRRLRGEVRERGHRHWGRELAGQAAGFLLTFLLVSATVVWGLHSGETLSMKTVTVPIDFRNLPEGLELPYTTAERVELQVSGQRPLIASLVPDQITAFVDLGGTRPGRHQVHLSAANFTIPPGMEVVRVTPSTLWVDLERRVERTVKVLPKVAGQPAAQVQVAVRPEAVTVSGPKSVLDGLEALSTEPVDVHDLGPQSPSKIVNVALVLSPASLRLARGQAKQVQVTVRLKPAPPASPPSADPPQSPGP